MSAFKAIVVGAVVAAGIYFGGIFAVPAAIAALGFGSVGIGAGSIAAGVQSMLYGGLIPAGSIFAVLQSVGATGAENKKKRIIAKFRVIKVFSVPI